MSSRPGNPNNLEVSESPKEFRLALYVYAAGSIATGIVDLIWRQFEPAHEPIQAWSDHIPGAEVLACIAAICLIVGGAAILWVKTARLGAGTLTGIYLLFGLFWLPRFYTAPHTLGFHIPLLVGLIVGVAQQLTLGAAAAILYALNVGRDRAWKARALTVARWTFGLSLIDFGLAHLTGVRGVATMVPQWMPLGASVWVILTGLAFLAAGFAMLLRIFDFVAMRLLAVMLFIFSMLVLMPGAILHPPNHIRWGSNAYNMTAVGATWLFAESLSAPRQNRKTAAGLKVDAARRGA